MSKVKYLNEYKIKPPPIWVDVDIRKEQKRIDHLQTIKLKWDELVSVNVKAEQPRVKEMRGYQFCMYHMTSYCGCIED